MFFLSSVLEGGEHLASGCSSVEERKKKVSHTHTNWTEKNENLSLYLMSFTLFPGGNVGSTLQSEWRWGLATAVVDRMRSEKRSVPDKEQDDGGTRQLSPLSLLLTDSCEGQERGQVGR